ncbi:MAG TPA: NADP-dependent oxidoreductase [Candidatus Dormibacteraeota bacterium]|nr:NADP-dependent oxidoreductase [Candidatus Dormibacteraeota bacterium]
MSESVEGREIRLAKRPSGAPRPDDFSMATVEVKAGPSDVLVRNLFLSVDPYMRGRMNDARSYVPPFALDRAMDGGAIGEVIAAPEAGVLKVGDLVTHNLGWREYALGDEQTFSQLKPLAGVPLSAYLGALGMTGLTAYVGLLDVAALQPGDVVFVSAAAGAVGGMVGQIAKLRGAERVIGSAGSDAKVEHLQAALGFDAAFNYHSGRVGTLLAEAAGDRGIDVYFDNVGGDHLEAAISALRLHGRVALCGAISQYNASGPRPGPANLALLIGKRLRLQGFLVGDHQDRRGDFLREVGAAIANGSIKLDETVVDGIESMAGAFMGMLEGANIGKMIVRIPN